MINISMDYVLLILWYTKYFNSWHIIDTSALFVPLVLPILDLCVCQYNSIPCISRWDSSYTAQYTVLRTSILARLHNTQYFEIRCRLYWTILRNSSLVIQGNSILSHSIFATMSAIWSNKGDSQYIRDFSDLPVMCPHDRNMFELKITRLVRVLI